MKRHARTVTIIIIAVCLLMIAAVAQIALVFNVTSAQIKQSGADRLVIAGGELEAPSMTQSSAQCGLRLSFSPIWITGQNAKRLSGARSVKWRKRRAHPASMCMWLQWTGTIFRILTSRRITMYCGVHGISAQCGSREDRVCAHSDNVCAECKNGAGGRAAAVRAAGNDFRSDGSAGICRCLVPVNVSQRTFFAPCGRHSAK